MQLAGSGVYPVGLIQRPHQPVLWMRSWWRASVTCACWRDPLQVRHAHAHRMNFGYLARTLGPTVPSPGSPGRLLIRRNLAPNYSGCGCQRQHRGAVPANWPGEQQCPAQRSSRCPCFGSAGQMGHLRRRAFQAARRFWVICSR